MVTVGTVVLVVLFLLLWKRILSVFFGLVLFFIFLALVGFGFLSNFLTVVCGITFCFIMFCFMAITICFSSLL